MPGLWGAIGGDPVNLPHLHGFSSVPCFKNCPESAEVGDRAYTTEQLKALLGEPQPDAALLRHAVQRVERVLCDTFCHRAEGADVCREHMVVGRTAVYSNSDLFGSVPQPPAATTLTNADIAEAAIAGERCTCGHEGLERMFHLDECPQKLLPRRTPAETPRDPEQGHHVGTYQQSEEFGDVWECDDDCWACLPDAIEGAIRAAYASTWGRRWDYGEAARMAADAAMDVLKDARRGTTGNGPDQGGDE